MSQLLETLKAIASDIAATVERYGRGLKPGKGQTEFHWVQIGGEMGADGKKHGGHPVAIDSKGVMQTGKFAGKTMGEAFGDKGRSSDSNKSSREPWQMTRSEYASHVEGKYLQKMGRPISASVASGVGDSAFSTHRSHVAKALQEGKDVPAEVMKDYPDLKPSAIQPVTRPNASAKPGDQMGLFGQAAAPARTAAPTLAPGGESKGKQRSLFDTKGPADQQMLFATDDVTPDEMVGGKKEIPANIEQAYEGMKKSHEQRTDYGKRLEAMKDRRDPEGISEQPVDKAMREPKKDDAGNEFAPGVSYATIPLSAGIAAHRGTSFVPEKRGQQRQRDFAHAMNSTYADLKRSAKGDEAKLKQLDEQWPRFLASARSKYMDALHADSRTMSTMITGGSNFPTARNRKKLDSAMNRWSEYSDFIDRATKAIHRDLHPELAPKKIGDADTGKHIETELDRRKKHQEHMKSVNKVLQQAGAYGYWRNDSPKYKNGHTKESTIAKLMELNGVDREKAEKLLKPDVMGHIGYASFELSNNNANIRRYEQQQQRQAKFETEAKAAESAGEQATSHDFEGGKVHLDYAGNRIRIAHDAKPSADVIAKLKSKGFRWSPANKAWQRQLTNAAKYDTHTLTGVPLDKLTPKADAKTEAESPSEPDRKRDNWRNIESGLNVDGKHKLSDGTIVSYRVDANDRYVVLTHPDGKEVETKVTDELKKKAKRSDMMGLARHVATQYIKTKYGNGYDPVAYDIYRPVLLDKVGV